MKQLFISIFLTASTTLLAQEKLLVLNEGTWMSDNSTLTYLEGSKVVSNNWFRDQNGQKLGDTANDIIQISDDLIAIAINCSNIIQWITPEGKAVAATEDIPNNRHLASDGRYLYVTSYANECGTAGQDNYHSFSKGYVAKIDVSNYQLVDAVEVGNNPEGIVLYQGHLLVANTGNYSTGYESTLSVIDAATMQVVRTIDTHQPNLYGQMALSGPYLCFGSPGDYNETSACTFVMDCDKVLAGDEDCYVQLPYPSSYCTSTSEGKILSVGSEFSYATYLTTYTFLTIDPAAVMSSKGQQGVQKSLPGTMEAEFKLMKAPYGIYVNPYTGYMYGTDAANYSSAGKLYQWSPKGILQGKHSAYICPSHFLALPPDGHFAAIEEVQATTPAPAGQRTYNLSGQRVSSNSRGLIIQGNKLILVKNQ